MEDLSSSNVVKKQKVAEFKIYESCSESVDIIEVQHCYPYEFFVPIYADDQFSLGRGVDSRGSDIADTTVSNRHVKVHCLLFDCDSGVLPPLVYVTDISTNGTFLKRANDNQVERQILQEDGAILLQHGDILRLGGSTLCELQIVWPVDSNHAMTELQKWESKLFKDRYTVNDQVLGIGGQGSVYAARHVVSARQVACKVLPRTTDDIFWRPVEAHGTSTQHKKLRGKFQEIAIMQNLDHPNVIRLEKVFWSKDTIYILQDMFTGGDLFAFLMYKGTRLHDAEAAVILIQILEGVKYLHDNDIVHRDLKLENILMTAFDPSKRIVITDFGMATEIPKVESQGGSVRLGRLKTYVGTTDYIAPEVQPCGRDGYTKAIDLWAIGIMTCILHSFESPSADGRDPVEYVETIPDRATWNNVSPRAVSFVQMLVVRDEKSRMTIDEALAHRWIAHERYTDRYSTLYKRAISAWSPRRPCEEENIVEFLDCNDATQKILPTVLTEQAKSKYVDEVEKDGNFENRVSRVIHQHECFASPILNEQMEHTQALQKRQSTVGIEDLGPTQEERDTEIDSPREEQQIHHSNEDDISMSQRAQAFVTAEAKAQQIDLDMFEDSIPRPSDYLEQSPVSPAPKDEIMSSPPLEPSPISESKKVPSYGLLQRQKAERIVNKSFRYHPVKRPGSRKTSRATHTFIGDGFSR